jgi:coenzyme F420-reducing hydrogenase beta subunit
MIELKKEECCGCGGCIQACPYKCIHMEMDEEGFEYPYVDKSICVNCHACEKKCPSLNATLSNKSEKKCFILKNNSEERMNSSSGGIFVLLAKNIIRAGGIVVGAAFDTEWRVVQKICDSESSLSELLSSKYLQSKYVGIYSTVLDNLRNGRKVLYVGTSCQVSGLKNFLGKEYENLYTVDILCHGVPSPGVWKRYLDELEQTYGSKIRDISFRDKITGWRNYSFTVNFLDGKRHSELHGDNLFMKLFLGNVILRPSCHECRYKGIDRASDMTIGDAWGIESVCKEIDDDKGASVVVIHNQKGYQLYNEILENVTRKEVELNDILPTSSDSRKPVTMAMGRALAFWYYKRGMSINKMCLSLDRSIKYKVLRRIIHN